MIGAVLEYAQRLGKPVMIYVFSDGSLTSSSMVDSTPAGRDKLAWQGDSSAVASTFFLLYNPNGRTAPLNGAASQQIGYFSADGSVVSTSSPGANSVVQLVEMVVLNYLSLAHQPAGPVRHVVPAAGAGLAAIRRRSSPSRRSSEMAPATTGTRASPTRADRRARHCLSTAGPRRPVSRCTWSRGAGLRIAGLRRPERAPLRAHRPGRRDLVLGRRLRCLPGSARSAAAGFQPLPGAGSARVRSGGCGRPGWRRCASPAGRVSHSRCCSIRRKTVARLYDVDNLPMTVLIDRDGKIRQVVRDFNEKSRRACEDELRTLLAE